MLSMTLGFSCGMQQVISETISSSREKEYNTVSKLNGALFFFSSFCIFNRSTFSFFFLGISWGIFSFSGEGDFGEILSLTTTFFPRLCFKIPTTKCILGSSLYCSCHAPSTRMSFFLTRLSTSGSVAKCLSASVKYPSWNIPNKSESASFSLVGRFKNEGNLLLNFSSLFSTSAFKSYDHQQT